MYQELHLMGFDYGQKHKKELEYAEATASRLDTYWNLVDLGSITGLISGSVLTSNKQAVPEGHYAEENMKLTVVPNRNMIMLSVAIAHAVDIGAKVVLAGMHAGDHPVYPDCRPEFIKELNDAAVVGNEGFAAPGFNLLAPFVNISKADIVGLGATLGVPFAETWSCYKGGARHCGRCGTCVERAEAFSIAGVEDPTDYADSEYWKLVTGRK
jgi:7-cyano-7-deazaguanine synthase